MAGEDGTAERTARFGDADRARPASEPSTVAASTVPSEAHRDRTIDGFRALAVSGVVLAHAATFRFTDVRGVFWHYVQRFAEPIAQTSVLIFFVISGYIITALLLREEARRGRIGLAAFYIRRVCRILPPLAALYVALIVLRGAGYIALGDRSLTVSALFGCNTGVVDCDWWVAHTWSLAVEEQFYLLWPALFLVMPRPWRVPALATALAMLLTIFMLVPLAWHSNYVSFACIASGVLCAVSPRPIAAITRLAHPVGWAGVGVTLALGPLTPAGKLVQALTPALIAYLIFAAREIDAIRRLLAWQPVQMLAMGSYSLYLWQQLFLARVPLYHGTPPSLVLLPVVVVLSVLLIERPMIRLGHRLSARWTPQPSGGA